MPGPNDFTIAGNDVTMAGSEATIAGARPSPIPSADDPRHVSHDRYRLGATLGEGGMAIVFEAHDANLNRPVAIKQLRDELRSDSVARRRFFHEAEILAGLDHAGLVAVHEAGVFPDGRPFYAMAKVRGQTLGELLNADSAAGLRVSMRQLAWPEDDVAFLRSALALANARLVAVSR